jgi:SRSO17 transposase
MERRFRVRLQELLDDAVVPGALVRGVLPRLEAFLEPFVCTLHTAEQRRHAREFVTGLLSDLPGKDVESIAYFHDQDRQALQKFIGQGDWDHGPVVTELARQVGGALGEPDGVLVFDPSAFPKKGNESVGVQRQWCGRLGKVENCQVGIYLGYVSRRDHALVDFRLFLSQEWARRKRRRAKAGVPTAVGFRTRHELMLEMLDEQGPRLPHAWVAGDDELGRSSWFRQELRSRGEQYLLAVPANTLVRDLRQPDPPYSGHGRRPKAPFVRADRWCAALPASAWQTVEVRAGEQGPLVVQAARTLVQARAEGKAAQAVEFLVVFRERQADATWKHDYLLAAAPWDTTLAEFARVFKAQHRIEEALKRAKSEAGLADYQVRTWRGWHHHQALSLLATWFLTQEARRGKNPDTRAERTAGPCAHRGPAEPTPQGSCASPPKPPYDTTPAADRTGALLSVEETQPFATATL